MNEETQVSGPPTGVRDLRARVREDWKRRQTIQPRAGTLLAPTLPERINRLNPSERHQLGTLIRSMKLRKIVRRTLAEAFWQGEARKDALSAQQGSMQRLRESVKARESLTSYDRALTTFEPQYTRSSHGDGNDSSAIRHALEQSMEVLR